MKKYFLLAFLIITLASVFTGCKKDDDDPATPITPTGTTIKTSVTGRVTDTNGNIVGGVIIKMGGITTVSDNRGVFLFVNADVNKTRFVLKATKTGYFNCISAKKTQSGATNYINLVMQTLPVAANVSGTAGGVVMLGGGAKITFPVNAFTDANGVAYTGQVKVYARHISPAAANFESNIPGGDLSGVNAAGQTQSLYSLGMIEAVLYDNSGVNQVKLASGKTAELQFPIDPSQAAQALATIPMWHLNETSGLWQEEGAAIKSGSFFIGNVSHFSIWNCDYSGSRADITGKVVDCQNNPMPGITVTINGFLNISTDNTGTFTTWVPTGYVIDCQVLQLYNPFLIADSPIQSITAISGQVNIVPTIVVACATTVQGTLKTCGGTTASPGFVYATWNGGSGVYFTNNGSYKIYTQENAPVNIMGNFNGFGGSVIVTTGVQGSINLAPEIQLCSAAVLVQNTFTINNNGGGSTIYTMSNIASQTDYTDNNSDGIFESAMFTINGTANPGSYNCQITMNLNNQTADFYPLGLGTSNNIIIAMDSIGIWNYASGYPANGTDNKLIFTDYGLPGGATTGRYNFNSASGSVTNGEFSIIRNE